jgi:hypothetical protein
MRTQAIGITSVPSRLLSAVSTLITVGFLSCYLIGCGQSPSPVPPTSTAAEEKPVIESTQPSEAPGTDTIPPKSEWTVTASALQEDIFPAQYACDDNRHTRWSSPAADPQWLMMDMGRAATVSGFTILWETAYSSEYIIDVSLDGEKWQPVYHQTKGYGRTAHIYIRPVKARFVRLTGLKRGTGWGHSIWEFDVLGLSDAIIVTAGTAADSDPLNLVDGDLNTVWVSDTTGPSTVTLDLRKPINFGGIRLDWGNRYSESFDVYLSTDGNDWQLAERFIGGSGLFDIVLDRTVTARFIRLELSPHADGPVEIRELTLRGSGESLTPFALYEIAAEKSRRGIYPEQLHRNQVYWTVVGLPRDRQESLLDEYGNLEPTATSCTLMPYLYINGKLRSAIDAPKVAQALENAVQPLPSVNWHFDDVELNIAAMTWGSTSDSVTFTRYRVENKAKEASKGRLFLAIRPFQINPTWQHGGLSPIRSLEFIEEAERMQVKVNDQVTFVALQSPDDAGARAFERGDVAIELLRGAVPDAKKVDLAGELVSGALAFDFDLQPGEARSFFVAAPLHRKLQGIDSFLRKGGGEFMAAEEAFKIRLDEMREFWTRQMGPVVFELPDKAISDTLKSQVGYILINQDGIAIQPGSRNYKRSWMRDGSLTSAGLLRMGLYETVKDYLDWYAARVQADGWVPPILNNDGTINQGFGWDNEYDSQGQFVYAIMEYYRFTKDREFLEKHFDAIHRALKYLVMLRERTLAPDYLENEPGRERFVGILPPSISHEGYDPPMHSYWDDFFALKGWKDGKEAAQALGREDVAEWAQQQYDLLRESVRASIEATIAFKNITYIPGCAEKGDMDASSTSIAFFPCEEDDLLPEGELRHTYEIYYDDIVRRLDPSWSAGYTPYEIRNLTAFIGLGHRDRALFLLDYIMGCRRPPAWNHLAEVVLSDPRMGSYIGDMPHTWVGSGFINSVRNMVVREMDNKLHLLRGARGNWVTDGDGVVLRNFPTYYGTLHMTAKGDAQSLRVELRGEYDIPGGMVLYWPPLRGKPSRVTINGHEWTRFDENVCHIAGQVQGVIEAEWAGE